MEKQKTAVEWLEEQLLFLARPDLFNQAKQMEKEQIMNARQDGFDSTYAEYGENPKCYLDVSNEQYYLETYGKYENKAGN